MASTTYYTVPRFSKDNTSIEKLNAPLDYIEKALNSISSIQNTSFLVQKDVVLDSDVTAGDLVYFDKKSNSFKPAIAAVQDIAGQEGQSIETDSSKVEGIVVLIGTLGSNELLKAGTFTDIEIANHVFGVGAAPGIYYLSSKTAGTASLLPGWKMRQPCLSYYGEGKFSFISHYLAHDNHHHLSYRVPAGSICSNDSTKVEYTFTQQDPLDLPVIAFIGNATTTFFLDGVLAKPGEVTWDEDTKTLKWPRAKAKGATALTAASEVSKVTYAALTEGRLVVFTHHPFAYGSPVVRLISSKSLNIDNSSGAYTVLMPLYTIELSNPLTNVPYKNRTAIFEILDNKLKTTPIISDIRSLCSDINVHIDTKGVCTLQSKTNTSLFIPSSLLKLQGAQRVSEGLFTYSVMPKGITSSIIASAFVYPGKVLTKNIEGYIVHKGTLPESLEATLYCLDIDTLNLSATSQTHIVSLSGLKKDSQTYHYKLAENVEIPERALLVLKLLCSNPTSSVYILNVGFTLVSPLENNA